jgi:hypothetical protein
MLDLFLDCGAFSAMTKKIKIDIDDYIDFVKKHKHMFSAVAALDVIGDAGATYQNYLYMRKKGLDDVIPTYHVTCGKPSYLKRYMDTTDYIAIGGMVKAPINLVQVLDELFSRYIVDRDGWPKVKVHGFGCTSVDLMLRYPWYSVDSTSWVLISSFGAVMVPCWDNKVERFVYDKTPYKIAVSDKSASMGKEFQHYTTIPSILRKKIDHYFAVKKFTVKELSEDYKKRSELNIIYFLDFEKNYKVKPFKPNCILKVF